MNAVSLLQIGSAFVLNAGFTWLVGSWFARHWFTAAAQPYFQQVLRRWDMAAAALALFGSVLSLWAATAVMGDTSLADAVPMVSMMLTSTAYGHAGALASAAIVVLLLWRAFIAGGGVFETLPAAALLCFAATRASMGHAGENGWLSLTMLAETVHYLAIGLWTGMVAISGWLVLREPNASVLSTHDTSRYLDRMSQAATVALVAIVVTGVFSAWHRVGTTEHLVHTAYGITLIAKVALVLLAIVLGGYNKMVGLPGALQSARGMVIVRRVLQAESFILFAALAAAAALTSQQPPAAM